MAGRHLEQAARLGDALGPHGVGDTGAARPAEVHDGVAHRDSALVEPVLLAGADDRARPAQHGDVVAEHHHGAALDRAVPTDLAVARRALAVLEPDRAAERPELAERT